MRPGGMPATAIVVGDGVVGLSVAIALQTRGVAVTLVAPASPWRGASWGNAGHLAVEQVEPLASWATIRAMPRRLFHRGGAMALPAREIATWMPFGARLALASGSRRLARGRAALASILATALPAWRALATAMGEPGLVREDGHFIVWESARTAARGRAHWTTADTGTARFRDADASERAVLRDLVRVPIAGALRCLGSGQITDPAALGEALHRHLAALGGRLVQGRATALAPAGHGATVRLQDGRTLDTALLVIAAGAASAPLARQAGLVAPLIAERGYHLAVATGAWPHDLPPVVFEDRSLILTRFAGTLRAASFVEFARADAPPDARKWRRLHRHLTALGLQPDEPPQPWMGSRPTLPDYLPAIGRSARHPAIAYAFGHQHLGLTLAATTGTALAAALCGERPAFDLTPFDLGRFGR